MFKTIWKGIYNILRVGKLITKYGIIVFDDVEDVEGNKTRKSFFDNRTCRFNQIWRERAPEGFALFCF